MRSFGNFLRNLRFESKLKIEEAALGLKIDTKKLLAWEEDLELPPEKALHLISNLYQIPYEELLEVWNDRVTQC